MEGSEAKGHQLILAMPLTPPRGESKDSPSPLFLSGNTLVAVLAPRCLAFSWVTSPAGDSAAVQLHLGLRLSDEAAWDQSQAKLAKRALSVVEGESSSPAV